MSKFDLRSLPIQLVISFVGLVFLTAVAAGLPAIWLITRQLDRQAWSQVQQGSRAAQALYQAQADELANLAMLTAQRPTLLELLHSGDRTGLVTYLAALQSGEVVDAIVVCAADQTVVSLAGQAGGGDLCALPAATGFEVMAAPTDKPQVWHFAGYPVDSVQLGGPGRVVVARLLNDDFSRQMQAKTGLEHSILVDNVVVASSLPVYPQPLSAEVTRAADGHWQTGFLLEALPYHAAGFPLTNGTHPLDAETALPVQNIAATQRELVLTLFASIVVVAVVGSLLGIFLAQRISRPLARLARAAAEAGRGELISPVVVNSGMREIDLVAQALEKSRADLQQSIAALQQEKAWTDHLLDSIVEGVVTLDDRNRVTFFSRGAERITGLSRAEVLHRHCNDVFPLATARTVFDQSIPASGQKTHLLVNLPVGSQTSLAITGAQLSPPNTENVAVALVFRDVSKEEAVHRLMGHFLANVAHEFRTPLSSLAASLELLLDQAPSLNSTEMQRLLSALHLSTLSLHTLVDNLLEGASIEAGHFRVHLQTSNLSKIIAEVIRTIQPLLDKREQLLVLELPTSLPPVRADFRRTVQVLINLVSNASKYGPQQAEITVSAATTNGEVRVAVADQGPGIAPEHKKELFRKFMYPNPAGGKAQYGAGLGLLVVKAIVDGQGGQVGVTDRPGGGSVFWFTLVVAEDEK